MTKLTLKRPIILNQSSMKTFQNCQRLYAWYRLQNLQPVGRRSVLAIGTAAHSGLAYFHSVPEAEPAQRLTTTIAVARKKLAEEAGPVSTFEDKTLEEALEVVDRILPAYVEYWSRADELWKPINQEVKFLVPVGDPALNVWMRGRADNLAIAKGGLYLVDYKTAGKMDPRELMKYEMDIQPTSYIYGLTKHLSDEAGEPVVIRGIIVDFLVKTAVPQFTRELFTRTDEELFEFEQEWIELSERIREQEDRVASGEDWKIVFPKNTEHCFRYGTCPFRDLCLKDTPTRRAAYDKRERDYVDEAYDELAKREAQEASPVR